MAILCFCLDYLLLLQVAHIVTGEDTDVSHWISIQVHKLRASSSHQELDAVPWMRRINIFRRWLFNCCGVVVERDSTDMKVRAVSSPWKHPSVSTSCETTTKVRTTACKPTAA